MMQYRPLGKSELKLPVVTFGAWAAGGWMWGGTDDVAAIRAMQRGIDLGLTCIDTAPTYGMGHSERVVGTAIAGRRERVLIATKCGIRWDRSDGQRMFDTTTPEGKQVTLYRNLRKDSIKEECDQSLQRMGIDVIDLYQCHWPDPTTPLDETMEALLELQAAGKVRAIGVSNFAPEMMEACLESGYIASDQPKYNALEREVEADLLPFCRENEIGVLAYSPIAQGMLTGKMTVDREFPEDDVRHGKPMYSRENRQRVLDMLNRLQPIADKYSATWGQLFIAWVHAQPGITTAIVGARNAQQVEENAKAGEIRLAPEDERTIRYEVEALGDLKHRA